MSVIQSHIIQSLSLLNQQPLVLACSGGVDSMVLLHELAALKNAEKIKHQLSICYVNHGLSNNADHWQVFVEQICHQLAIAFVAKKVTIDRQSSESLEAQARQARYLALKEVANDDGFIVTGHHLDDQVETFLLALKRGAGIKGLSAMKSMSTISTAIGELTIIRPLLAITRQQIIDRARELGIEWIEDESNQDCQFDRNFLRQQIIPELTQRWPGITTAISRSTEHCQDAQQLIDEVAGNDLTLCLLAHNQLSIEQLQTLSKTRFNNVIRYYFSQQRQLMPTSLQLEQLWQQLDAEQDKTPEIKLGQLWFRRYQGALYITESYQNVADWQFSFELADLQTAKLSSVLPDGLGELIFTSQTTKEQQLANEREFHLLSLSKQSQIISVCFSHQNPVCLPEYRQHSRVLKKVFQELNIPPWQRKRIPLIFIDGELAAAVGYFVCKPFLHSEHEIKLNVSWLAPKDSG